MADEPGGPSLTEPSLHFAPSDAPPPPPSHRMPAHDLGRLATPTESQETEAILYSARAELRVSGERARDPAVRHSRMRQVMGARRAAVARCRAVRGGALALHAAMRGSSCGRGGVRG